MEENKNDQAKLPETPSESPACGNNSDQKTKLSSVKIALVIMGVAILLGVLAAVIFLGMDRSPAPAVETTEVSETEAPATIPADGNPDDETAKGTYTASDEDVIAAHDTVVARMGDDTLTNGQLQMFYWTEVRNFLSSYGSYASYVGLDPTKPLDVQTCAIADTQCTWQQFFLEGALNSWNNYRAMAAEADANGFELTEQQRATIDNAAAELEEAATANGFESGIAMLHSSLGAGAELEDYVYFMELYYKANGYYAQIAQSFEPTDEQLDDYFEEHAEGYASSGITKDTKLVNVRHILVYPEGADGTNLATQEFSEEAWAASEKKAQEILDQFLSGDKTEESFAALANEYSEDPGSNTNGGLYEDVSEGEMVAAFNDWCFDAARQVGDTGIVKTNYGYHVMYFSGSQTTWQQYARNDYMVENATAAAKEIAAKLPMTVQYSDILLANSVIQ